MSLAAGALGPRTLRGRLALFTSAALAVVLLVYSLSVLAIARVTVYAQLDHNLLDHAETAARLLEKTPDGSVRWRAPHADEGGHASPEERWIDVFAADGRLRCREPEGTPAVSWLAPPAPDERGARTVFTPAGRPVRVLAWPATVDGLALVIRVGRPESAVRAEVSRLLLVLGLGLPLAVLLSAVGGSLLARRALAPVTAMADRAQGITAERLHERLPLAGTGDELERLGAAFNATLERLERSFEQLRRFTADASHEMRTPLAALRSTGEVALQHGDLAAAREAIGSMLEETERLTRLVESLLTLARADAGTAPVARAAVDLVELAREVASLLGPLAEERGQTVSVEALAPVTVTADRALLRRALVNVLDNAIKYGPRGSRVTVRAGGWGANAVLEVADEGPGIAAEHHARVFDRFYRVDPGRSRDQGGTGLGLAIARWAVEANGGRIELESAPDRGSTFRILLGGN